MPSAFIDYMTETLGPLGTVRSKRMFGGVGVYINELFCAIIVDDCLYFKGDDDNAAEFAAVACAPFTYQKEGVSYAMRYYRVPDEAMDEPEQIRHWARLGLAAALRKDGKPKAKVKKSVPGAAKKPRATRLG
jgi:DNA transformation protein